MSACEPLVKYMMKPDKMKSEINLKNALGTGGEVADASTFDLRCVVGKSIGGRTSRFQDVFLSTTTNLRSTFFLLRVFYITVEHQHHRYMKQQDSMEMFSALMDNLHEDLNRVRKNQSEPVEDKSRPDDVVAKEVWEVYMRRKKR